MASSPRTNRCSWSRFASRRPAWCRKAEFAAAARRRPGCVGRASIGRRDVWLPEAGGFVSCALYERDRLPAGNRIEGPAIVEQMDATTLLPARAWSHGRTYLNLIMELA